MGITKTEWLTALPSALDDHALVLVVGQAGVQIGEGLLQRQALPPHDISLLSLHWLTVTFALKECTGHCVSTRESV